ncbi:carbon storage regulator CsrA [Cohnella caldifontis]|uniref:carbon storage regulator CsrA n=1 Tax=Cohnella caldifontis TaxID=3027471 RepID=UPI0023EB3694|nr:carbon storage regulator CsrA [Cohnella sp. YIM B05605]
MLVLKRKVGETVKLGDTIEVQVLAVEGETVKLGFTAPRNIQILRKELYDGLMQENLQAGQAEAGMNAGMLDLLKSFKHSKANTDKE